MTDTPKNQTVKEGTIYHDEPEYGRLRRWFGVFSRLWYVQTNVTLLVYASPAVCLGVLVTSAKPSIERLHLRNLFAHGRRYHFVSGSLEGFRMETTTKILWRRKDRTRSNATLSAKFQVLDTSLTQINMTAHVRIFNILSSLWIPIFFTPLFLFAVWQPLVVRLIETIGIYVLAWVTYRYDAAIDAHDMVYFIEKALEDFVPKSVPELSSHVPHVVDNRKDFPDAWEKFYEAHSDKSE